MQVFVEPPSKMITRRQLRSDAATRFFLGRQSRSKKKISRYRTVHARRHTTQLYLGEQRPTAGSASVRFRPKSEGRLRRAPAGLRPSAMRRLLDQPANQDS